MKTANFIYVMRTDKGVYIGKSAAVLAPPTKPLQFWGQRVGNINLVYHGLQARFIHAPPVQINRLRIFGTFEDAKAFIEKYADHA